MKKLLACILFYFSAVVFSQDNNDMNDIDDFARRQYHYFEAERLKLQSIINTYDDLVCTFWINDCNHSIHDINYDSNNHISFNKGYVFLPNNMVLAVSTFCSAYYSEKYNEFYCEKNNIRLIDGLSTYEIIDEELFFDYGITDYILEKAYLKEHYLYVSFDDCEYERFRIISLFDSSRFLWWLRCEE
jgi:hypothetical protein